MKNTAWVAHSTVGIAALALLTTLAQADAPRYSDINNLALDMANAVTEASKVDPGDIIDIELEMEDSKAVWELDIVTAANQVITVEIDGQTGEILSTKTDDDTDVSSIDALNLSQAIAIVKAVEQGAMVEAELENDDGALIWEIESIDAGNQPSKYRVDAQTGEILS